MIETDRKLNKKVTLDFEEKFISNCYFGCLVKHCFVVLKKRSLLLYDNRKQYLIEP